MRSKCTGTYFPEHGALYLLCHLRRLSIACFKRLGGMLLCPKGLKTKVGGFIFPCSDF